MISCRQVHITEVILHLQISQVVRPWGKKEKDTTAARLMIVRRIMLSMSKNINAYIVKVFKLKNINLQKIKSVLLSKRKPDSSRSDQNFSLCNIISVCP